MRLFYALSFSEQERERLHMVAREAGVLCTRARIVRGENLHMTLRFLGESENFEMRLLQEAIHEAARLCAPFSFSVRGLGRFGSTLWLGATDDGGQLKALSGELDAALRARGIPPERAGFKAHITIARDISVAPQALQTLRYDDIGIAAERIFLMRSEYENGRLVYRPIEQAALAGRS